MFVMSAQLKRVCLHDEVKEMADNSVDKYESKGGIDRRSAINAITIRNVQNASSAEN
jgi:hypothetical protein